MANTIKIKQKTTAGAPSLGQLADGEMCWNRVDKVMYIRDSDGIHAQYGKATEETGNAIGLSNPFGSTDIDSTPYTANIFTLKPNPVLYGWGVRKITTAGKTAFPTVTGATYLESSPFEAGNVYWVNVINRGDDIYYTFEAKEPIMGVPTVGEHTHPQSDIIGLVTDLGNKVDKVSGKKLSTNDYTSTEKSKLTGIEIGAQKNVQPTWGGIDDKPPMFPPEAHTHDTFGVSKAGFVPARVGSVATKYLNEDGSWKAPPNTTYTEITESEITTGTSSSLRAITARRLKFVIDSALIPKEEDIIGAEETLILDGSEIISLYDDSAHTRLDLQQSSTITFSDIPVGTVTRTFFVPPTLYTLGFTNSTHEYGTMQIESGNFITVLTSRNQFSSATPEVHVFFSQPNRNKWKQ